MAYGSPSSLDEVEAYYTHIRRGRPPEPEQLADLVRRYEALGGVSPLRARTDAQAAAIEHHLDEQAPGGFRVALGTKHAAPFIEDAVRSLTDEGITTLVGLVLAPHFSRGSVGEYLARAREEAGAAGAGLIGIEHWYELPEYVDFLTAAVAEGRAELPDGAKVLFTAHSLPLRVLEGDPYPDQLRAGAEAVAARAGLAPFTGWALGWQSAGRTPDPWAGPDVLDVIRDLAATGRATGVLVCPHGFVSDHLEVRYDLDIEAAAVADEVGLAFGRTRVLNDDPAVMGALAGRIVAASRPDEP